MTHQETATLTDFDLVVDALRTHDRFVVVTHENPDGDALGSMLGATLGLRALGKDVVNYSPGELGARTVEILDAAYRSSRSGQLEPTVHA